MSLFWCLFVVFSSWREDICHRLMSQWGKNMPYFKTFPAICAQASPWNIFPSLTSVPQQGISEKSWPALTLLKPLHSVRVYILLHWRHRLPVVFWGRRSLMPESWQQSNRWARRPNSLKTHPSLPLFRASRRRHSGVLPPSNGQSLLQRLVGALLWELLEIYFLWVPRVILISGWASWWCFIIRWCQSLGLGTALWKSNLPLLGKEEQVTGEPCCGIGTTIRIELVVRVSNTAYCRKPFGTSPPCSMEATSFSVLLEAGKHPTRSSNTCWVSLRPGSAMPQRPVGKGYHVLWQVKDRPDSTVKYQSTKGAGNGC